MKIIFNDSRKIEYDIDETTKVDLGGFDGCVGYVEDANYPGDIYVVYVGEESIVEQEMKYLNENEGACFVFVKRR